ncbi:glycosyltransferase [uncultured Pseudokineococcus sp.]|uniref:glycosyltransferase n=1 Tax=uncultured Pseudokineococcus sp. TaxID=1642928 RepID=UPI0026166B62|nr:glycosyltransferase [uncultured Pseudokineococcus sp.]
MIDLRTVLRRAAAASGSARPAVKGAYRASSAADVLRSGLVDRAWYQLQAGRTFDSDASAAAHYVLRGRFAGLSPCPLFEPEWYLPQTWREADRDPLATYLRHGAGARVSPHPLFEPDAWLAEHPEAAEHPVGALGHFLAVADRGTELPVPAEVRRSRERAGLPPLRYGDLLDRVAGAMRERAAGERVRTAPRVSSSHDWAADAAHVAAAAAAPLPSAPPGSPLVSVVMPVYDRATTVVAAIASLQAQTTDDWELVVVDDGSTDGTGAVLAELAAEDPRIVVVPGEHVGISVSRNLAASRARGRYLAFLDSDNTWTPHFLRTALADLAAAGGAVGYATSELRSARGSTFRALDAQVDHFAVRNHVDLNVLVVERALFEEVGGFDASLRRTVDYDLVWRLGKRSRLHHLPFVGVVYDDDAQGADRVTVRELHSWKDVVRSKHLVDWEALSAADRVADRVSAVVVVSGDWLEPLTAARSLLAAADAAAEAAGPRAGAEDVAGRPWRGDAEVVLVEWSTRPSVARLLAAASLADPRIVVEPAPDDVHSALGTNLGLARATGDHVLLLAPDAVVPPGAVEDLLGVLAQPGVAAAQALLLEWTEVVRSAGWVFPERGVLPSPLLHGHPREDARRLGPVREVPSVDGGALMARTADLVAVRGADALLVDVLWDADLGLRLAASTGGRTVVVTTAEVVRQVPAKVATPARLAAGRRAFLDRWSGREPADGRPLWEAAGLRVTHYAPRWVKGVPLPLRVPEPVVSRPRALVGSVREAAPRLRWAVRTATPPGVEGLHWGDLHFAEALQSALTALGQEVVLDGRASLWRPSTPLDDVTLSIRGKLPLPAQPGAVNLLWVISHPEMVTAEDVDGVDAAFAASAVWARTATAAWGREVLPLLQATDPSRFTPDAAEPDTGHPVLFVGNSRGVHRPVVRHLVEAGEELAVYGGGWEGRVPAGFVRGLRVANAEVPAFYRSAGVVLNDHWDDMRRLGFVSNRLFDAAAAGARVVSDHVEGVEELFGGLVRTYREPAELVSLVRQGASAFPGEDERVRVARGVARDHSFLARAEVLLDAAVRAHRRRAQP